MKKISIKWRDRWVYILFTLTSLLFVIYYRDTFSYQFAGSADFISPLDINNNIFRRLFIYNPYLYGGINSPYLIPHLFPEFPLFYIGKLLNVTPLIITHIYIASIIFLAQFSLYNYLTYISKTKLNIDTVKSKLIAIFIAIFYGFSPTYAALIAPGHFVQSVPYVLFPLFLKQLDILLVNKTSYKRQYLIIYLIFLLSATAFSNIGIVYVILLTLFMYLFLSWIVQNIPLKRLIKRTTVILCLLVLSNIWWMFSFASVISELNGPSSNLVHLNAAVTTAVQRASVFNIFFGRPENQLYYLPSEYYINQYALFSFVIFAFFFLLAIIVLRKNKYVFILVALTLIGLFLTKGPHEPFSDIYLWIYNNIIGFQIFRRPVSKYWGMFIIFYLSLAYLGAVIASKKMGKVLFGLFLFLPFLFISAYTVFAFLKTAVETPFNVPEYYYQARTDLSRANANKILYLPGTFGIQPIYNSSINNLYASDLLQYVWDFSLVAPDSSNSTPNEREKKYVNNLMAMISKKQDACNSYKELGISHVLVREDLSKEQVTEVPIPQVLSLLNQNPNISGKKAYYDKSSHGFTLFTVKPECRSNVLAINNGRKDKTILKYNIQNPTRINIELRNVRNNEELYFLHNFMPTWKLHPVKFSDNFISGDGVNNNLFLYKKDLFTIDELFYIWRKTLPEKNHSVAYGYANKWLIDAKEIKRDYPATHYTTNKDGSVNVQFVLYHKNQSFVVYGFLIFIISVATGAVYLLRSRKR